MLILKIFIFVPEIANIHELINIKVKLKNKIFSKLQIKIKNKILIKLKFRRIRKYYPRFEIKNL